VITLIVLPLSMLMRDKQVASTEAQKSGPALKHDPAYVSTPGMTLSEAMRTRAFWTLNLMVLGCCMCCSCILLHGFNHMTDVGVLESVAARVVMLMAVFGMIGKIINGLLADRIGAKWAIALFLGLQAVMIPFFIEARQAPSFYSWAILFGLGFGGPMPVYAMLFREYFGTRAIGTILGAFFMVASIGMGSGGMMGGFLHSEFGDYVVPFLTSTSTGIMAAILALTLPSPKRETRMPVPQVALQTG